MLSRKEINEKKRYIIERLKGKNSQLEETKLKSTLISFIILETDNDHLKNVRLYNIINTLSKGKLTLKTNNKIYEYYSTIQEKCRQYVDDDYLFYLLQLARVVAQVNVIYDEDKKELMPIEMSDEEKVELSKAFYNRLNDPRINEFAQKILADDSHFGFTSTVTKGNEMCYGHTVYDRVFNKPYISTQRLGTLMGCQAFNHEIMHAIDYYSLPKDLVDTNRDFREIPTYTIDYLFLDYLEEIGFDKQQVNALRRKKLQYTKSLAKYQIVGEIRHRLNKTIGMNNATRDNIQDIRNVIDDELLEKMLELESCVIAHGLYLQILNNREVGLNNLNTILRTQLPANKVPDFSFIGLYRETILKVSKSMLSIKYDQEYENQGGMSRVS